MPKYLARVSYKAEGVKGLVKDKASGRRAAVNKMMEAAGGRVESFYFAFGSDDVVVIFDLPDAITAAATSLAVNATGQVHLSLTPLISVEEMDAAIGKSMQYRPPGA